MAIDGFEKRIWQGMNYGGASVRGNGTRTPEIPLIEPGKVSQERTGTNYDKEINDAYKNGGMQGLLDYLDTLSEGVVSNFNSEKDAAKGLWIVTFSIGIKCYKFVENWTPESPNTTQKVSARSAAAQTDDYDSVLSQIAEESGIDGLVEYLNSLEDGLVTFMHRCNAPENYYPKREYLVFTLSGKNYTFCATTSQKDPNSPEVTETKEITDRTRVPYEFIVNDLYEKGDIQGLVEYLDTLDSGVLTFYAPQKAKDGTTHYVFTLNGHGYNFEVKNWPDDESVDSSKEQSYTAILNKIFCQSGVQGILEYLTGLEEGVLTGLSVSAWVDTEHNIGHWGVSFSINGKSYGFSEASDAWDETFIDKYYSYNEWSDIVTSASDVNEYDIANYKDKVYILGGDDEEANIEQLRNDIEKCNIKGQMKEKFMKQYLRSLRLDIEIDDSVKRPIIGEEIAELIFELDYNKILESVLNDLTPSYTTNKNGELVPCVNFEDVIQRLIFTFQVKMNNKMGDSSDCSSVPFVNGYNTLHNAEPVKYKNQTFEVQNEQDFEYKREKMKKFMMDLKDQFAKSYGISSDSKQFAALFEECVDSALEYIKTTRLPLGGISGPQYTLCELRSQDLVSQLNVELGERIDYDMLKKLRNTEEENEEGKPSTWAPQKTSKENWQASRENPALMNYIKNKNVRF